MYAIDNATAAAARPASTAPGPNPNGWFTKGNPAAGVPATIVDDEFLNELMAEVMNAVKAAGLTPTKGTQNQLATAIQALVSSGSAPNSRSTLGVNVAGGANVTLSATQAGYGVINLVGALTANIAVIFPATGKWTINNQTTGAFSVTAITPSGTGYVVRQGFAYDLYADGTNIQPRGPQTFWGTTALSSLVPAIQSGEVYYLYS